jgi:hypothetical protein
VVPLFVCGAAGVLLSVIPFTLFIPVDSSWKDLVNRDKRDGRDKS